VLLEQLVGRQEIRGGEKVLVAVPVRQGMLAAQLRSILPDLVLAVKAHLNDGELAIVRVAAQAGADHRAMDIVQGGENQVLAHRVSLLGLVDHALAQLSPDGLFLLLYVALDQVPRQQGLIHGAPSVQDESVEELHVLAAQGELLLPVRCRLCSSLNHGALLFNVSLPSW
jgi:hypothetical protein